MRLIDADALEVVCFKDKGGCFSDGVQWVLEKIDALPTVQPQTGHWKPVEDSDCWRGYICDKCGKAVNQRENFCPNCGARMVTE